MHTHCTYDLLGEEEYVCSHPVAAEGLCVFHAPKLSNEEEAKAHPTKAQVAKRIAEQFNTEIWKLVDQVDTDPTVETYDFRGFSFPEFSPQRRTFKKKSDFRHATFTRWVNFEKTIFSSAVSFEYTGFQGGAWFIGAIFKGDAEFSSAVFGEGGVGHTNFFRASFEGVADFLGTRFDQGVSFRRVTFNEGALFGAAAFAFGSDFTSAIFKKQADFRGLTTSGRTIFARAEFQGVTRFSGAVLSGETIFQGDITNKSFSSFCRFNNLRIANEGKLVFEKLSLEQAAFVDTDLKEVMFRDVDWYHIDSRIRLFGLNRAQSLWDEFRPIPSLERDYAKIAENYNQLVLNYEGKRDFDTAEDFHIGEMEMRRKQKGAGVSSAPLRKFRESFNAYGIYKASSNYGTSYGQAFLMLILLVFFFSLAFLYSGFRTTADTPPRTIEYNVFPGSNHRTVSAREWLNDYLSAMSLCASVVTFQKDRFYEPLEGPARGWLFAAVIALTGQAAMTLLALRRRFRR